MAVNTDAARLLALADAIAEAIPKGATAITSAIAGHAWVAGSENRAGRDGAIVWVTVALSGDSPVTVGAVSDAIRASADRSGPPRLGLVSPSNVPPSAWGQLPVYVTYPRPWGELACEHAHGDSLGRIRKMIIKRARGT
jgi:hypothetical protein